MAAQSFRDERVPPEAREAFEGRLMALSHAHSLLTRENWESAPLTRIAEGAVAPFGDGARFRLTGAPIRLNPKAAVSVALALHELCTNAAKYGALSTPSGVVEISWTVPDDPAAPFTLCWREAGGPPVIPPQRRGFGSRLVERGLASELGGRVSLNYPVSGVICEIAAPLAHVEAR
jgi:two-component sensor histidine kinase